MTPAFRGESCDGQTIDITVGQTVEICLPENPTTKFHRQPTPLDGACAR
jgi:hypothetical protein